jgi:hypothetical protein
MLDRLVSPMTTAEDVVNGHVPTMLSQLRAQTRSPQWEGAPSEDGQAFPIAEVAMGYTCSPEEALRRLSG